mmetsp:Transcript_5597/g.16480  ORF Transcript_5597/g.16480 Transcript_5597/m.16480 type:complete len:950 (+) Transcript_5597:78-2927(+)
MALIYALLAASVAAFRAPISVRRSPFARPAVKEATRPEILFEQQKGGASVTPEAKDLIARGRTHLAKVSALEAGLEALDDDSLKAEAAALKAELSQLDAAAEPSEEAAARTFALAREAAWRVLKLRAYDVQVLGGYAMATGNLAEMATGEGKTLAAIAPTLLGALRGKGALVVTANDYLARRDADSVGLVLRYLGLTVGLVESTLEPASEDRREAYSRDVTYVSNAELGFDYLRDQLALGEDELVLPRRPVPFYWCLVDEADSILIDEARTPLIISETTAAPQGKYGVAKDLAEGLLVEGVHYDVDLKGRAVQLTEQGYAEAQAAVGKSLFDAKDPWAPFVLSALRAKELLQRDRDYLVTDDGEVKLVDAFSGRVLEGRRYADGLQQAVEAKEGLTCSDQTRPTAVVTFQALFRTIATRLAGMTGTASTDGKELKDVYGLEVVPIPTALPVARKDYDDAVYGTVDAKERAAAAEVARQHKEGRPILIGTTGVDASDAFVARLKRDYGIEAEALSARPDAAAREAAVVAQAGRVGAVTVATNMAGRGTDIKLGGSAADLARLCVEDALLRGGAFDEQLLTVAARRDDENPLGFSPATLELFKAAAAAAKDLLGEVDRDGAADVVALAAEGASRNPVVVATRAAVDAARADLEAPLREERARVEALGGLYVLGTERHESSRIDNQLRGRAGRQGDPGASRFFVSVRDPMFVNFGGDNIAKLMSTLRVGDDLPVEAKAVTDALTKIQAKVEGFNAEQRTNVLKFDDVSDGQRRALYGTRRRLLLADAAAQTETLAEWTADAALAVAKSAARDGQGEDDARRLLEERLGQFFGAALVLDDEAREALGSGDVAALANGKAVRSCVKNLLEAVAVTRPARPATESFGKLALLRLDALWAEHLLNMNYLKENVQLRSIGQTDPFQEFQREGFELFTSLQTKIKADSVYSMLQAAKG